MLTIDSNSLAKIQKEIRPDEKVLWAGRPNTNIIFRSQDLFLIPFSLLWGGFAIFWEMGVTGYWGNSAARTPAPAFMIIWGIPFVTVGQYVIWGRFFYAAWKKKRTYYAVTDRRVLVVQDGWTHKSQAAYIDTLPAVTKVSRPGKCGTVRFGQQGSPWWGNQGWEIWDGMGIGNVPVFVDIDDADEIDRLVSDLRDSRTVQQ